MIVRLTSGLERRYAFVHTRMITVLLPGLRLTWKTYRVFSQVPLQEKSSGLHRCPSSQPHRFLRILSVPARPAPYPWL